MSLDQGIRPARCAYGVWLVLALIGAWAYHALTPFSLRAAVGIGGGIEALPGGYRLYLSLQPWLWGTPVCFLVLGLACQRLIFLRHPVTITLFGGLLSALYIFMGILLATPYFIYAGSPPFPDKMKTQLRQAEELTVYALWTTNRQAQANEKFHSYSVAGKIDLKNHPRRREIIEGLIQGSETNSVEMMCFYPHHGLRATYRGKVIDLLICFGCGKVEHQPGGEFYRMNKSAQPLLDSIIVEAGIPLPPPSKTAQTAAEKTE